MTQSRETAEANSFAEAFEASLNFKTPEQGELLRGQIVSISGDDAFVSYGGPSEAVMATNELDGLDVGDMSKGRWSRPRPTSASRASWPKARHRSICTVRCTRTACPWKEKWRRATRAVST